MSNARRRSIYIRDEDSGDLWSATPLAHSPAGLFVCHPSRLWLHAVRACLARNLARPPAIRAARGSAQDSAAQDHQPLRDTARQLSITHYVEWVLGNQRSRTRAVRHHGDRPQRPPRSLARNPWSTDFPVACRLHGHGRTPASLHAAIGRNSSAATDRWPSLRRCSAPAACRIASAAGWIPAVRCRPSFSLRARRGGRSRALSRTGGIEEASALRLLERYRRLDLDAVVEGRDRFLGSDVRRRSGEDTRSVHGCASQRLAALSDARLPVVGAHGASINRAAPRGFATNCRM